MFELKYAHQIFPNFKNFQKDVVVDKIHLDEINKNLYFELKSINIDDQ